MQSVANAFLLPINTKNIQNHQHYYIYIDNDCILVSPVNTF